MAALDRAAPGPARQAEARALLRNILEAFARLMVDPVSAGFARFIMREQMEPTAAFERLHAGFIGPTFGTLARLVAEIRGGNAEDPTIRIIVPRLIGQVMVLRAARATVLRELGWDDIGAAEFELIRASIEESVAGLDRVAVPDGDGS
jgi:hypothetical protein